MVMTRRATMKPIRKKRRRQPQSKILSLAFLFAIGATTHSAEAFSGVHRGRKTCIRMVDDERISEEEILAMGGDPFFLPDDDESKAKETTEKNQQQPLLSLSPQQQQLLQTLDTQYQELGNQYKAIGETISALKKEFGVADTTERDTKKNNNSQTASEILSNMAIGSATAEMPSFGMLSSLNMLEDEVEEERELTLEEQRLEIEEMGGDPFFLDDGSIDVENEDSSENQPSEALMAMAGGGNGETPSILGFLQNYQSSSEDEDKEGGKELSYEERKLEIEELGGDPFFLGEEDDAAVTSNVADRGQATRTDTAVSEERRPTDGMGPTPRFDKQSEIEDPADFEWDGIVNEDAHLDFD